MRLDDCFRKYGLILAAVGLFAGGAPRRAAASCDACIDSWDYGYCIGDRVTSYTHWTAEENEQQLCRTSHAPKLNFKTTTKSKSKRLELCECKPTVVTRTYASPSIAMEPRCVPVEVAFGSCECCIDRCCRVCCTRCVGPPIMVPECDFNVRQVERQVDVLAETVECHQIKHTCKFERKTKDCKLSDEDFELTSSGCKLTWTGERRSAATGCATLTKVPAVHTVHVTCASAAPMHCVACKYTSLAAGHGVESDRSMPASRRPSRASAPAASRSASSGHAGTTAPQGPSAPDAPKDTATDTGHPAESLPSPHTAPPAEAGGAPGATDESHPATSGDSAPSAGAAESKPASSESK
jgi:hypothetical protein